MAKLYVVPTPVGNLEDMTMRAIRVLKEADCVLAEDTRTSGILMKHFEIKTRMQSHHKFNDLLPDYKGEKISHSYRMPVHRQFLIPVFYWSGNVGKQESM